MPSRVRRRPRGVTRVAWLAVLLALAAGPGCRRRDLAAPAVLVDSLLARDSTQELRLVRLRDARGTMHEGWLRLVPPPSVHGEAAAPGSSAYEPVLVLGGIGTGRRAAEVFPCPPGFAVLALDYPYAGPRQPTRGEVVRHLGEIHRAAYAAPRGVTAGLRYLEARPDTRRGGTLVVAASFGVPFVLRAIADLPRARDGAGRDLGPRGVRAVSVLFGGADFPALVRYRMRERPWWEREAVAWGLALFFGDLDPRRTVGRVAPRPLLLVNGTDDEFVSAASARALERAARQPKRQLWLPGSHLQPDADRLLVQVTQITLKWLREVEAGRAAEAKIPEPAPGYGCLNGWTWEREPPASESGRLGNGHDPNPWPPRHPN
jgi:hypothetical protein